MIWEDPFNVRVDHPTVIGAGRLISSRYVTNYGTVTSGTIATSPKNGKRQKLVNGGAFVLAAPSIIGDFKLVITNNASAGTILLSGFGSVFGDALDTTNGSTFECAISFDGANAVIGIRRLTGRPVWSSTLNSNATGATNTSVRNVHSGLLLGGTQVRVLVRALTTGAAGNVIVDNASIGVRLSGDQTTAVPVELLFNGGSGFNLPAGASMWSDLATLTFADSDVLMTTFDFAAGANNFPVAVSDGNGRYAIIGNGYNVADFPGTPSLIASQCACVAKIETS
jgi:hypothetical protein